MEFTLVWVLCLPCTRSPCTCLKGEECWYTRWCYDGLLARGKTIRMWCNLPDTYAPSYLTSAISKAGAVAALAEERKRAKYCSLAPNHLFTPVAIETSGAFGTQTLSFVKELGQCLRQISGDPKFLSYLLQRLSVTVQRGYTVSVLGSLSPSPPLSP